MIPNKLCHLICTIISYHTLNVLMTTIHQEYDDHIIDYRSDHPFLLTLKEIKKYLSCSEIDITMHRKRGCPPIETSSSPVSSTRLETTSDIQPDIDYHVSAVVGVISHWIHMVVHLLTKDIPIRINQTVTPKLFL